MSQSNAKNSKADPKATLDALCALLDPEGHLPALAVLLGKAPEKTVAHLHELVADLDPLALSIVTRVTSDELLTADGRDPLDAVGIIHFAVAVAPVLSASPDHPGVADPDGSVAAHTFSALLGLKEDMCRYWRVYPRDFALEEKNRLYHVRGYAFLHFMPLETVRKSRRISRDFDRYLTWVGSAFDLLRAHVGTIIEDGSFDRKYLESLAYPVPTDDDGPEDDDEVEDWDAGEEYRNFIAGWDSDDRTWSEDGYSVLPYSQIEELREKAPAAMCVGGVALTIEDYAYLGHFCGFDELPDSRLLALSARFTDGRPVYRVGHGEIPILFLGISDAFVEHIANIYEGYSPKDQDGVFDYLCAKAWLGNPMQSEAEFKDEVLGVVLGIPFLRAFHDAEFEPEPFTDEVFDPDDDVDPDAFGPSEQDEYLAAVEESRKQFEANREVRRAEHDRDQKQWSDECFSELISEFVEWRNETENDFEDDGDLLEVEDDEEYQDILRMGPLCFMLDFDTELTTEHAELIAEKQEAICRNASAMLKNADLSIEALKAL